MDAQDELTEHGLRGVEVGDHAGLQRPDHLDVLRRAAEHLAGFLSRADQRALLQVDRDVRGLREDDAPAAEEDQGVGRPEIDPEVVADRRAEPSHSGRASCGRESVAVVLHGEGDDRRAARRPIVGYSRRFSGRRLGRLVFRACRHGGGATSRSSVSSSLSSSRCGWCARTPTPIASPRTPPGRRRRARRTPPAESPTAEPIRRAARPATRASHCPRTCRSSTSSSWSRRTARSTSTSGRTQVRPALPTGRPFATATTSS